MATRRVTGEEARRARRVTRRRIGRLSTSIIKRRTRARYDFALQWFFRFLCLNGINMPDEFGELDDIASRALDSMWEQGEAKSLAGDLLSGLSFDARARSQLRSRWRLFTAWGHL